MSADPTLVLGGKYSWRGEAVQLVYLGARRYAGDPRRWYRFAKVDRPGSVWCEVLESDLKSFEVTAATDGREGSAT